MKKKKYYFEIILLLIVIIIFMSLYYIAKLERETFGQKNENLFKLIEKSKKDIETNLDEIAVSSKNIKWKELKKSNIEEEKLKKSFDLLLEDIKTCYLDTYDIENKFTNNVKIISFKNKYDITKKELKEILEKESCIDNFNKYETLVLSEDEKTSDRMKAQIKIIIEQDADDTYPAVFSDAIYNETIETRILSSLSKWLRAEYNRYL